MSNKPSWDSQIYTKLKVLNSYQEQLFASPKNVPESLRKKPLLILLSSLLTIVVALFFIYMSFMGQYNLITGFIGMLWLLMGLSLLKVWKATAN